jgi:hypothetical protein
LFTLSSDQENVMSPGVMNQTYISSNNRVPREFSVPAGVPWHTNPDPAISGKRAPLTSWNVIIEHIILWKVKRRRFWAPKLKGAVLAYRRFRDLRLRDLVNVGPKCIRGMISKIA